MTMSSDSRRILVTGATGFIGSHVVATLIEQGYDVYALERYVTGRYTLGELRRIKTVFGDLRDHQTIRMMIREVQPDVVHLAAVSPVSYSYEHPYEVMETNFLGTMNLAESCLKEVRHLKNFLFASTSKTYGNGPCPKTEETPQNPNSPYAASKVACEKYLQYLYNAFGFPVTILRNFNTYGRKENSHFVVERTIVQMLRGNVVRLGDPKPVRDFLYVDDHVNSFLKCLENHNAVGQTFNFCTGRGTAIAQLVDLISRLVDFHGEIIWGSVPSRPLDIQELVGSYTKAERLLGWTPRYSLEDGLKLTIDHWSKKIDLDIRQP